MAPVRPTKSNVNADKVIENPSNEAAIDSLLAFCESQIKKMNEYSNINSGAGTPSLYELNEALISYSKINYALISLNAIAKVDSYKAREAFDDWFADRYCSMRRELNPLTLSAQKWISSREIELEVRRRYPVEYKELHDAAEMADQKVAFMRRLLDSWDRYSLVLNRLCRNQEIEATKLGQGLDSATPSELATFTENNR